MIRVSRALTLFVVTLTLIGCSSTASPRTGAGSVSTEVGVGPDDGTGPSEP